MHLHKLTARLSGAALLLLAAAAAAPVAAAAPAASLSSPAGIADDSAPSHAAKADADEPRKICRTIETTSSRLQSKKLCLTREQWRNAKYN
jgi:Ni/Co efflux regulator RcnB